MNRAAKKFSDERREKWISFVQSVTPDVNPGAVHLMDEMRLIAHTLYQIGELSVTTTGLSYAKYRLLMGLYLKEKLEDRCEMNPSEISEQQGTSRNTISALIRDLEEDGLLERSLDQEDRRKFNIQLTEEGRRLVHDHVRNHFRTIAGCFSVLDQDEKETFSRLLAKLRSSVYQARDKLAE
ncbi:MAG TPA: MarR family winged helix-turn-helix transcriptional regulator [Candidatus Binatia bacterium]|nr:MarR family winged helix-turn-helix transcriptional regulator [Candidatus Binatia bacterium]